MHRTVAGLWNVPDRGYLPALAVVSVCFLAGGLAGCVLAACVSGGGGESLAGYVQGFLRAAQAGELEEPALAALVWNTVRWPLMAVLMGFTAVGLLGLPVLFLVRGFLLAFSIASFVRVLGGAGCLLAVLIFGITGVVALPALFVLGVQSLTASRSLAGRVLGESRRASPYGRAYFLRCGSCAAACFVCVAMDYLAVPALVSGMAGVFLTP